MYKLLLCWRYLRTRWIALASIISVTLGVATMIVVNSVMEGFRHEMQERIHGILSDLVFEANNINGFPNPDWHMEAIRGVAGEYIEGMTATVVVPAMLCYQYNGTWIPKPVQLIGIDERTQSEVGDFCKYLQHPANRERLSFELRDGGYDTQDHQAGPNSPSRPDMADAGWAYRQRWADQKKLYESLHPPAERPEIQPPAAADSSQSSATTQNPDVLAESTVLAASHSEPVGTASDETANPLRGEQPVEFAASAEIGSADVEPASAQSFSAEPAPNVAAPAELAPNLATHDATGTATDTAADSSDATASEAPAAATGGVGDIFATRQEASSGSLDPATQQNPGVVIGIALASWLDRQGQTRFLVRPGDDVQLMFPTAGTPPKESYATFTVVDMYESKMSEYDSSFVFVPIEVLQRYRGMFDPQTGQSYATSIQIKLKPGADGDKVRDMLRAKFMPQLYNVSTWRDKQGPLLAAVQMETAILNVLLFMIIFVAGFGILAIFFMIVVEKTRDIGILKALGASRRGILGIFLGYGLSLGVVGAGAGMILGLLFVAFINEIADVLGMITGQEVFDPSIYYFQQIPTIVVPATVTSIVIGALVIAVLASVLPARRAARLHPVEALRYE